MIVSDYSHVRVLHVKKRVASVGWEKYLKIYNIIFLNSFYLTYVWKAEVWWKKRNMRGAHIAHTRARARRSRYSTRSVAIFPTCNTRTQE